MKHAHRLSRGGGAPLDHALWSITWNGLSALPAGDVGTSKTFPSAGAYGYRGTGNTIGFTGHRYDKETGLYLARFRSYAPRTGRWMQRDPAGYQQGVTLYQYALSRPSAFSDPLGLVGEPLPRSIWRYDYLSDPFNWWLIRQFDGQWDVKDFVYHYYDISGRRFHWHWSSIFEWVRLGTGAPVDLGAVGRGSWYESKLAVQQQIARCRALAAGIAARVQWQALCGNEQSSIGRRKVIISGKDFEDAGVGFVIGGHQFSCSVRCSPDEGGVRCSIEYSMRDRFEDPADIFNLLRGRENNIEPGGTPYDIEYDWEEHFRTR